MDKFCYLGGMIGAGGGAEVASRTRVRSEWKKFNDLGPLHIVYTVSCNKDPRIFACTGSGKWEIYNIVTKSRCDFHPPKYTTLSLFVDLIVVHCG